MKTYQDLLELGDNEKDRQNFLLAAIAEHRGSDLYRFAVDANAYYEGENPTITRYEKVIYDMTGKSHKDMYTANHKIKSSFFQFVVDQENGYLLGNGVTLKDGANKERLGKGFDGAVSRAAQDAIIGGVSFGFWAFDHLEIFDVTEFVPLYDEENGALMAGIRFWQVSAEKPMRCTLYEMDGYTEYIRRKGSEMEILREKRPYILQITGAELDDTKIYAGENYPTFPIVPLRYTKDCRSELRGRRNTLDALDLAQSNMVNNVDEGNLIYWVLTNCGGMDISDAEQFLRIVRTSHVAFMDNAEDGARAEPHTLEAPYAGTQIAIDTLIKSLYRDFQALDTGDETLNTATATGINFRYAALDLKCDKLERQVTEFLHGVFALAGVEDEPTYTRNRVVNRTEEMEVLLMAAEYLDDEYITTKALTILGDGDIAKEVLARRSAEELSRTNEIPPEGGDEDLDNGNEEKA